MTKLTLEKVMLAHEAYGRILEGLMTAQRGFEDLMVTHIYRPGSEEYAKLGQAALICQQQSGDIAKCKGALALLLRSVDLKVDVFSTKEGEDYGQTETDPN